MSVSGIGVDVVSVSRIKRILSSPHAEAFLKKAFTKMERDYIAQNPQRAAATFAGKEAVFKALGTGWTDGRKIEITHDGDGRPGATVQGMSKGTVLLSLSHERSIALALAFVKK